MRPLPPLAKAKAEGRESVHVRAWLPIPAECLAQSEIELQSFTEQPGRIADANAPSAPSAGRLT